jgi:hypothetical protein
MIFASDIDHMRRPWPIFWFWLEPIEPNQQKIHGMMNTVGETIVSWKKGAQDVCLAIQICSPGNLCCPKRFLGKSEKMPFGSCFAIAVRLHVALNR